jgi:hypothetical protein
MNLAEPEDGTTSLRWRKSSRCDSSSCVEVAVTAERVAVRDSKNLAAPNLSFSHAEWSAFVAGVRAGDFDLI